MNSGTRNYRKAGRIAQQLADANSAPYYVFIPATGVGGNLWVERIPSWWVGKEQEWAKEKERQGGTVYWPRKDAR